MSVSFPSGAGAVAATPRIAIGSISRAWVNPGHENNVTGRRLDVCKKHFESSKNRCEIKAEVRALLKEIAGPRDDYDSIKKLRGRAAVRLGFLQSRVDALWYGNARRIDAEELDFLRDKAREVKAERAEKQRIADSHFAKVETIRRRVKVQPVDELPIFTARRRAGATEIPNGPSGGLFAGHPKTL